MQHAPHRDLASAEVWEASLERSRRRRVLAAQGRREVARRKQASAAVSAAMAVSPTAVAFASAGQALGGGAQVATASSANRAIAPAAPAQLLRMGSTGPDVIRVQSALGQATDGIYGPQTNAAVRVFQSRNGLLVDGIVGPRTWGNLFGAHGAAYDPATPRYQFQIQRASASEVATVRPAIGGQGPVAKIVLRSAPAVNAATPQSSSPATPSTTPAVAHSTPSQPQATPQPAVSTPPVSSTPVSTSCGSSRIVAPVKGYVVTGVFGEQRPGHTHSGIDLAVASGTPIVAAACGVVTQASAQSGYGNMVCIQHSSSFTTCYAHMSRFASSVGQTVHQGQVIGYVGCTGNCTGPHVHFETRVNGTAVDPAPYLSGSKQAKVTTHGAAAKSSSASSSSSSKGSSQAKTASSGSASSGSGGSASGPGTQSSGKGGSTSKPAASSSGSAPAQPQSAPPQQQQQQAAPAQQQSAPAQQPAPAAQPAPAETQAAPAPAAPAPVQQQAAPAAPAPVEQAAPVQQAPAAPAPQAAPAAPAQQAPPTAAAQPAAPQSPPPPADPAPAPPQAPAAATEQTPAAQAPAQPSAPEQPAAPQQAPATAAVTAGAN